MQRYERFNVNSDSDATSGTDVSEVGLVDPVNETIELMRNNANFQHLPRDFTIKVGDKSLTVNKQQFATISQKIYHSPKHATAIKITDLNFETIETAVDYFFYRKINATIEDVIGILRFAHKLDIKVESEQLEELLLLHITDETFCLIWQYAFDRRNKDLLEACAEHFRENVKLIVNLPDFEELDHHAAGYILVVAYNLNDTFEVLRCAVELNAKSITAKLESIIMKEPLLLSEFCRITLYATEHDRLEVMTTCAKYFSLHMDEVAKLDAFMRLPAKAVIVLFKLGFGFERLYDVLTFAFKKKVQAATHILENYYTLWKVPL